MEDIEVEQEDEELFVMKAIFEDTTIFPCSENVPEKNKMKVLSIKSICILFKTLDIVRLLNRLEYK